MRQIPPLHEYWDRPKAKDSGDSDSTPIYHAVGCALTTWEQAENKFADLFAFLLEAEWRSAARVYGTLQSNGAKQDAIKAAAEVLFLLREVKKEDADILSLLLNHLGSAAARRNDIAHAMVTEFVVNGKSLGLFLTPPDYSTKKNRLRGTYEITTDGLSIFPMIYRYTTDDIQAFAHKFRQLSSWTKEYAEYLGRLYPPPK